MCKVMHLVVQSLTKAKIMSQLPSKIVSIEIVEKLVEICNQLESKQTVTSNDIRVSTFENGFSLSNIFRVDFINHDSTNLNNNRNPSIVIKLYPQTGELPFEIIDSQLNNLTVGQSGLGPSVQLIRPYVLVSEFVQNSHELQHQDDHNLVVREQIVRQIARFHRLEPPISRNTREKYIRTFYEGWISLDWFRTFESGFLRNCALKNQCMNLVQQNFQQELDLIKNRVLEIKDEKLVFSHNDLNHTNILVNDQDDSKIRFVDFDYSCYFYRGVDLGRYISDCTNSILLDRFELISDQEMRQIVVWYLDETRILEKSQEVDLHELNNLLAQSKLFTLLYHLFDVIFWLWMTDLAKGQDPDNNCDLFMTYAEKCFNAYFQSKSRFETDGTMRVLFG